MQDILLATDGREGTDTAIERAIEFARQYDATLHIIYVVDTGAVPALADTSMVIDRLETKGEEALESAAERAKQAGLEDVETVMVHDRPHEGIIEYANENGVDMIVMGTHGRAGLERRILGSVSDKVVRQAEFPVLTVPIERE